MKNKNIGYINFLQQNHKIGIVIPIYNVAKYLRECLDSVANQSYGNFCTVLVNDGSCDDSFQIALDFVANDSRFVLINKKNGGHSSARNAGISWLSGKCNFGNSHLELHSADFGIFEASQKISLVSALKIPKNYESQTENPSVVLNADSHEAIQTARHTEHSEVSKSRETNKSNESMAQEQINNSHKFTQSKKIVDDSKVAKVDSSLTAFAQNDEFMDCHDSALPNLAMTGKRVDCFGDKSPRNDESSHLTLYTHKNATNPNPPKIDYIIFLDSDDFWESDLLEKCVDSALKHKAQIVWFSWKTFYDGIANINGGGESTWLGIYGYTQEGVINNVDWFNRAKENNINIFTCSWDKMISFEHFKKINLEFLNGVVQQDVLFAELLFAQSWRIAILPEMLVNYRVRQNNTTNFSGVKQKNLPPFVKPLEKYFSNSNEAWEYFRAYSWCAMASEFVKFCNSYGDKVICEKLKECFLGHLLSESCAIMNFKADPYNIKDDFLTLAKRFGKKYLPRDKKRFAYYNTPILWQIYNIYPLLKSAERKFRRWRRSKQWF